MKRYVFECEFSAVAETAEAAWEHILEGELQERAPEPTRVEEACPECGESARPLSPAIRARQKGKTHAWHCPDCNHTW